MNPKHFLLACLIAAGSGLLGAVQAEEPTFERIFGPEVRTGPYKHPACLTELSNGDFYLVYYGGADEYAVDTGVFGARLRKGASGWTTPQRIAADPFRSVGNAVVWEAPDGLVWLFYVVRFGKTWSTSRVQVKVSHDLAESWSDSSILVLDQGTLVRNRPIVLENGDYLLPLYHETGEDTEESGPESYSFFLRYVPNDRTWSPTGPIRSPRGNLQPAPAEIAPGRLIAFCRRAGDYRPETVGHIIRSESRDGGQTWSEGVDTEFPNPNAAIDLLKLQSGRLLLVYNNSMNRRTPLTLALSSDSGTTWPVRRNLREGNNDFGYPIALQARDGKIHIVYTSDRRSVVNRAILDEAWILETPSP